MEYSQERKASLTLPHQGRAQEREPGHPLDEAWRPLQSAALFCLFLPGLKFLNFLKFLRGLYTPRQDLALHTGYTVDSSSPVSDSLSLHRAHSSALLIFANKKPF